SFVPFFFFQAEDGIRDFHVTGVQTCALPISTAVSARPVQNAVSSNILSSFELNPAFLKQAREEAMKNQHSQGAQKNIIRQLVVEIGRASWRERVEGEEGGDALRKNGEVL